MANQEVRFQHRAKEPESLIPYRSLARSGVRIRCASGSICKVRRTSCC